MAQNSDNLFTEGLRGTVGKSMTFRRRKSGKVVVSKKRGPSSVPPTDDQLETMDTFKMGTIYAKGVIADPSKKALQAAAAKGDQSAYNVAMRDACVPPEIKSISAVNYAGAVNDTITVRAIDDFKVVQVRVKIETAGGVLIEQGNAVVQNGLDWLYTATQPNANVAGSKITATAFDTPGNETALEITL